MGASDELNKMLEQVKREAYMSGYRVGKQEARESVENAARYLVEAVKMLKVAMESVGDMETVSEYDTGNREEESYIPVSIGHVGGDIAVAEEAVEVVDKKKRGRPSKRKSIETTVEIKAVKGKTVNANKVNVVDEVKEVSPVVNTGVKATIFPTKPKGTGRGSNSVQTVMESKDSNVRW